jgi:hypothetical protein
VVDLLTPPGRCFPVWRAGPVAPAPRRRGEPRAEYLGTVLLRWQARYNARSPYLPTQFCVEVRCLVALVVVAGHPRAATIIAT